MKEKYIPVYGVVPIKDWDWKQCHTDLRKMNRKILLKDTLNLIQVN